MGIVKPAARLFVLLALKAPIGVIFRRGPSNQVLLIKWDLDRDTFEFGQWLKGRVYERRCDISPTGDLLLYFASDSRRAFSSWSAISRPPYFSAIAIWPKGNTFGGGGIFSSQSEVLLDRQPWEVTEVPDGFSIPKWLTVGRMDRHSWEEFDPSSPWSKRLNRDGWTMTAYPDKTKDEFGAEMALEFDPPITWQKANPRYPEAYTLQMSILGLGGKNGPSIVIEYSVVGKYGDVEMIGRSEWAEWSHDGDLLFAQSGCLFRLRCQNRKLGFIEESEQLADFTHLEFHRLEPPEDAFLWPRRGKQKGPNSESHIQSR
jgi:hypothetical protein